jgi:hypothetical protein
LTSERVSVRRLAGSGRGLTWGADYFEGGKQSRKGSVAEVRLFLVHPDLYQARRQAGGLSKAATRKGDRATGQDLYNNSSPLPSQSPRIGPLQLPQLLAHIDQRPVLSHFRRQHDKDVRERRRGRRRRERLFGSTTDDPLRGAEPKAGFENRWVAAVQTRRSEWGSRLRRGMNERDGSANTIKKSACDLVVLCARFARPVLLLRGPAVRAHEEAGLEKMSMGVGPEDQG